jgi:hypothetical protein
VLIVVSSINLPIKQETGTYKNKYPQFLKTSPASISYLIQSIHADLKLSEYFTNLTDPEESKKAVKIAENIRQLKNLMKILPKGPDSRLKGSTKLPDYEKFASKVTPTPKSLGT